MCPVRFLGVSASAAIGSRFREHRTPFGRLRYTRAMRGAVARLIVGGLLVTAGPPAGAQPLAGPVDTPNTASIHAWHEGLFPPATVYLEPVVLRDDAHQAALQAAAAEVAQLFEMPVVVRLPELARRDLPNADGAPYQEGDQLLFPPVAAAMQYTWQRDPGLPDALAILAVSGAPIGFPTRDGRIMDSPTWSMRGQGIAAVSVPLLLVDVPAPLPPVLARDRLAKALARMLGHALGLSEEAGGPPSVMTAPATPRDLDALPFALSSTSRIELRVVRALCALADGRTTPEELEAALRTRVTGGGDAAAAALLGILLERRDARAQAELALDQAMALDPAVARVQLSRARLAYRAGDWERAARAWAQLAARHPYVVTWAAGAPADHLLAAQGLPGREDGAAATVWREPLEQAQAALEVGDAARAAAAAREALTRELDIAATHGDRAPFTERGTNQLGRPSRVGVAAAVRAVAAARLAHWDEAADALELAIANLDATNQEHLAHVGVRIAVGRGAPFPPPPAGEPDRRLVQLRAGLEARRRGDRVGALDAWAPLLGELHSAWAPNVPAVELAELYADRGDVARARDVLLRARPTGLFDGRGRDLWAKLPGGNTAAAPPRIPGRVRRYSVRRFRPAIVATPDTLWLGTSDGIVRVDRRTGRVVVEHVAKGLPPGAIEAVAARGDTLWLGTTAGLFRREGDAGWTRVIEADGTPVPAVTALLAEPNGALLVGTAVGLCSVTVDGRVWWPSALPRARVAALALRERVAAATFARLGPAVRQNGMWRVVSAPNPVGPGTRFGGIALDAFRRVALVQSHAAGLAVCRETPFAVYCDDLPIGTTVVGPVAAPDGGLWLAAGREVAQWDAAGGWMPEALLPEEEDGPVLAVQPDGDGGVWVVTPESVFTLRDGTFVPLVQYTPRSIWQQLLPDPRGGVWKVFSRSVVPPPGVVGPEILPPGSTEQTTGALVLSPEGAPWAVAGGRLYTAEGGVWVAVTDIPAAAGPLRLWMAGPAGVWADDGGGLWAWTPAAGWRHHDPPADLAAGQSVVRGVVATTDGRVWVAWADRVRLWHEAVWTDAPGLPRRTMRGLAAAGAAVWVATAHDGVYRLGPAPAHWSRAEGLPANQVAAIATSGATVWIAAGGGVSQWDGARWVPHHVGNLPVSLAADHVVPTAEGGVWFQVGNTWYQHWGAGGA